MADLLLILRSREKKTYIPRYLRDIHNPLDLPDDKFIRRFRLNRESYLFLCDLLQESIHLKTSGHSVEQQVLVSLMIFAAGSFQNVTADDRYSNMSQSSVSRSFSRVTEAICQILPKFIKFPMTEDEKRKTRQQFYDESGFPRCLGIIDGTHVQIQKPPCDQWYSYVNRKGKFTINVQLVCDTNLKISNVVARWPGSCHDSFIWGSCQLRSFLSSSGKDFIIGDSGYPLEPWLMKPYDNPRSDIEENFNSQLRSLRNRIERCNGVLKSRFRCLDTSGGHLLYDPAKSCKIILACCVLHNLCLERNVPLLEELRCETVDDDLNLVSADNVEDNQVYSKGCIVRNQIARYLVS